MQNRLKGLAFYLEKDEVSARGYKTAIGKLDLGIHDGEELPAGLVSWVEHGPEIDINKLVNYNDEFNELMLDLQHGYVVGPVDQVKEAAT